MRRSSLKGFTLVETLVGVFVFTVISLAVYQGYLAAINLASLSRAKTAATLVAEEQTELARNLPYASVGVPGGIPNGLLPKNQTLVRSGFTFIATTTVRNVDDPFDGTIGGSPGDLAAADYKLVSFDITCPGCRGFAPLSFNTTVGPKNLETSTGNGALFVKVLNASGQPVANANVHVENNKRTPPIVVDDITNQAGVLQLVDVPPGTFAYEVTVNKPGYSSERTYSKTDPTNPNPVNPHATVATSTLTNLTLAIDQTGSLGLETIGSLCQPIGNVPLYLTGSKLIGTSPSILKYKNTATTDGSGFKNLTNLEWDSYQIVASTTSTYDVAGTVPLLPIVFSPGANQSVNVFLWPRDPRALLVTVKDAGTGLPLADATVTLSKTGFSQQQITERGFFSQTDWSGGGGQPIFSAANKYDSDDGNIDYTSLPGDLKLRPTFGTYAPAGTLTSSIFDTGTSTATVFRQLSWTPLSQPVAAGALPVKAQLASGNDPATTTWSYLGPDGTAATYYTPVLSDVSAVNNGNRYARYRLYLATASSTLTPQVSDVSLTYSSGCLPFGQVFFHGLASGVYTLTVSHAGYQTYTNNVISLSSNWQAFTVSLVPSS